jgi:hypothetical protein
MKRSGVWNRLALLVAAATISTAGGLQAQVAWEAPMLASPLPPAGFGVYLADVAGGDLGVFGTWRGASAPSRLEFRFGIAESGCCGDDDISGLVGVTISGLLARESSSMPFDVSWLAGAGVGFGDWALITIPFGISAGHTFRAEGFNITPYVSPRIFLDAAVGDPDPPGDDDDTDLGLAVDLGFDVGLRRGWALRFGASLGDHEAFAFGIVF